jgi:phosphoserine phosphatase RsbU/P
MYYPSMFASMQPLTIGQVLQGLQDDGPYLFLGAAFTAVGAVGAGLAFVERKFNAMLFWLGLFSTLYGLRLCLQMPTFELMLPPWRYYGRLQASINYLVPIPAIFYFDTAGFLGRIARKILIPLTVFFFVLSTATLLLGWRITIDRMNSAVVIGGLGVLVFFLLRERSKDKNFVLIEMGLMAFVACALWDNFGRLFSHSLRYEPLGFAFFLQTLAYVAVRRTLVRDEEFGAIQKELEIARRIQMENLPGEFPESANFEVAARCVPMTSVAGDFYDFVVAEDKRAGLLVADVSGHGVPAALIASMVKLAASSQRANAAEPAELLAAMNQALCGNTQNQFVTAAYVHLDADTASLRYAAAAHPPMLLLRAGKVISVEENGLMLAAFAEAAYTTAARSLERGDRLALYTDGIVEAANADGAEFGQERLGLLLVESRRRSPQAAVDHVIAKVQAWSKIQSDDLTVLICDFVGDEVGDYADAEG